MTIDMSYGVKEWSLTPANLAEIGEVDEFYETYLKIREIYEDLLAPYANECKAWNGQDYDKQVRKAVMNICDPVLLRNRRLFTNDDIILHANAYGFEHFQFCYYELPEDSILTLTCRLCDFDGFLREFQVAVTRILYRRRLREKPQYKFEPFFQEVNTHIDLVVKQWGSNQEWHAGKLVNEPLTDEPLYKYESLISTTCHREHHKVEPAVYIAASMDRESIIRIPCHYCTECKKYYIGAITYSIFMKNYGRMVFEKYVMNSEGWEAKLQNESKLHRLGYNVIKDGMTENERQSLLLWLLDHKRITYREISETLEWNIRQFENSFPHRFAVREWMADQEYISRLVDSERVK
ncbi:MAG: hypothetical protein LIO96_14045 [Lachnospiraceae bacterium]|nr:hypothetical protein [Lachnospiraceae bacterium]